MRILILSPFFHPEPISTGKYNSQLASALVNAGHEVDVICSYPIYPTWVPEATTCDEIPGTHVSRGGLFVRYPTKAFLRRAVLEFWYTYHVAKSIRRQTFTPDIIICVFPPSLFSLTLPWLAAKHAKVVGIVHDLQGVYIGRSGSLPGRIVKKIITAVEKKGFALCDKLIFLSEEMLQWTVDNYGINRTKSQVSYPFVTLEKVSDTSPSDAINSIFTPGKKYIVYSGALGEKQNPEGLYKFFEAVTKNNPDWEAKIFSQGPLFDLLKKNGNEKIKLYPLVSTEDLPFLLQKSDIQVVPQAEGTSDGSLPSKLPNIIQSRTRLLCITDQGSELSKIISRYNFGAVSTSWDISSCMNAFNNLTEKTLVDDMEENSAELLGLFSVTALVDSIASIDY